MAAPAMFPLGYDPRGKMEQRSVRRINEAWSEYELDDGTIIKTRTSVIDVKQAVGQYNPETGDPIYIVQGAGLTNFEVPTHLKKKK
jgi:hypothetical protein